MGKPELAGLRGWALPPPGCRFRSAAGQPITRYRHKPNSTAISAIGVSEFNNVMSEQALPHEVDHTHSDVTRGWLRPATFGAMDGLVTNTALIAGVGAVADAHAVILSGVAGLVAGAFSMALGEYTSVTTANEQIDAEVLVEQRAFRTHPNAEKAELAAMFENMGLSPDTAQKATDE